MTGGRAPAAPYRRIEAHFARPGGEPSRTLPANWSDRGRTLSRCVGVHAISVVRACCTAGSGAAQSVVAAPVITVFGCPPSALDAISV